ncbi:MAG: peptidoglycan DD-metalloendopeptidase family protein [Gammaproteobacteria bacterium]|nr:peptidoglycan DD-metalloendopeptidase family protein [Gammaproteobacteria bacterium]
MSLFSGRVSAVAAILITLTTACGELKVAYHEPYFVKHRVSAGETLYALSLHYDTDYREIAAWNSLSPPYTIFVGQELLLIPPHNRYIGDMPEIAETENGEREEVVVAAVQESRPPPATASRPDSPSPPVKVERKEAPAVTGKVPSTQIRTPTPPPPNAPAPVSSSGGGSTGGEVQPPPTPPTVKREEPKREEPKRQPPKKEVNTAKVQGVKKSPSVTSVKERKGPLQWSRPAKGSVTAGFNPKKGRKGIDIAGTLGAAITAAEAGEVVYSGDGLKGYGNLIIIRHNSRYLSAYGHNRRLLVREGMAVNKGQKIAEMGKDSRKGVVLHFEIRKNGKPIDPTQLLPAG